MFIIYYIQRKMYRNIDVQNTVEGTRGIINDSHKLLILNYFSFSRTYIHSTVFFKKLRSFFHRPKVTKLLYTFQANHWYRRLKYHKIGHNHFSSLSLIINAYNLDYYILKYFMLRYAVSITILEKFCKD